MAASALPIGQVLLKLNGRCNLKCDYCYIYEHADQGWRRRPAAMPEAVIAQTARRLREYAADRRPAGLEIVFHGGEPLLAGADGLDRAASLLRDAVDVPVSFVLQTNGTLIDTEFLRVFRRHAIRVGVSLDGGEPANDRHRRYAGGRGSFARVARGLDLLRAEPDLYAGLLCTVDVANDPVGVYEDLPRFAPPRLDLLLPHGTWDRPPPGRGAGTAATPYADWLVAVFDRWYDAPAETSIRLFESICDLLLGGRGESEAVGLGRDMTVTIEPDGAIGHNDFFKITEDGGAETGLDVFANGFGDVLAHPAWNAPSGLAALCATCRACPVASVCGGGLPAHRFRAGRGLDNPSVYCPDLLALITHVRARLAADLERLRGTAA